MYLDEIRYFFCKTGYLCGEGEVRLGDRIVMESPMDPGIIMEGKVVRKTKVDSYEAIIPEYQHERTSPVFNSSLSKRMTPLNMVSR